MIIHILQEPATPTQIFELAQIQRQLSRWHTHWWSTWASDSSRLEISTLSQIWANRIREMAGVLV